MLLYAGPLRERPALPRRRRAGKNPEGLSDPDNIPEGTEDKLWVFYLFYFKENREAVINKLLKANPKYVYVAIYLKVFGLFPFCLNSKINRKLKFGNEGLFFFNRMDTTQWLLRYNRVMADSGVNLVSRKDNLPDYVKNELYTVINHF